MGCVPPSRYGLAAVDVDGVVNPGWEVRSNRHVIPIQTRTRFPIQTGTTFDSAGALAS